MSDLIKMAQDMVNESESNSDNTDPKMLEWLGKTVEITPAVGYRYQGRVLKITKEYITTTFGSTSDEITTKMSMIVSIRRIS